MQMDIIGHGRLEASAEDDSNFINNLFFGVNAACFIVYTVLAGVVLRLLKGVPLERRTINIMLLFFFTFLRMYLI